jgi:23S rRNA (uracil1939-C5)-methyltransferase
VEKLVYGGDGLARLDGRVVLVPYVLPGEHVRAKSVQAKAGLVRASLLEVVRRAEGRVDAPCPVFGRCGGCHYQHATYDYQVEAKCAILVEELQRVGKIEPPEEIAVVTGEPWGYRNRAQFHIDGGRIGYWEARSHRLCAVERCPIASPKINEALATLATMVRDPRWPRFVRSIEVFTDEHGLQLNVVETDQPVAKRFFEWCAESIPGMVESALDYEGRFRVSRNSFFQVNRLLLDQLVDTALDGAGGEAALDLYAGVGLFALALAKRFPGVTAVESGSGAVRDLGFNAGRAGAHIVAAQSTTEAYLEKLDRAPEFVLADPPRAGLGKAVVERLAALAPPTIVIVACDPATMARDLAGLLAAGYRIDRMTLVDLFPQTFHLETVIRLVR